MRVAAAPALAALAIAGCGRAAPEAAGPAAKPAWAYDREATGGPVSLRLRLDRVEATLADTITLEQELRVEEGFEADFPEYLPEDFEGFSVVEIDAPSRLAAAGTAAGAPGEPAKPGRGGAEAASPPGAARRKRLVLEPERSGDLAIAPLAVYFRRAGEAKEASFLSEEIPVQVQGLDDVGALALRDPIGIFATPPRTGGARVLPWALAGGGAIALAAAGAVLWLRRPRRAPPPVPPHEVAYESLRRLVALGLIEKGEVELFFVHLSAILRQYIENRFQVRAPERTTEEFLAEAARNPAIEHHRVRLGEFLELSDQVKFARFRPEEATIQGAFDTLKSFLVETTPDAGFEFHHPWVLLLLVPALALFWFRLRARRTSAAILFPTVARVKGLRPTVRQRLRVAVPALQALAVMALVVAAARPRQGDARTIVRSEGIAIQMVLDRSTSMEDKMRYSGKEQRRIDIVKEVFARFVAGGDGLPGRKTDLIGLTTFARFTEESCPLVSTHEPLLMAVKNLATVAPALDKYDQPTRDLSNQHERGLRPSPLNATAIGDGLQRAVLSLITAEEDLARGEDQGGYKIKGKVAILLTDGKNNAGEDPVEAGQSAAANGIRVYAIIFTELVEYAYTITGARRAVRELSEDDVLSEAREIVKPSGGHAFLARSGEELKEIYQEIDRLERSDVGRIEFKSYHEKYRWFLIPGLAAALVAFFLAETVFRSIP